jgi:hypothetical protein
MLSRVGGSGFAGAQTLLAIVHLTQSAEAVEDGTNEYGSFYRVDSGRIRPLGERRLKPRLQKQNLPPQVANLGVRADGLRFCSREFDSPGQSPNH